MDSIVRSLCFLSFSTAPFETLLGLYEEIRTLFRKAVLLT